MCADLEDDIRIGPLTIEALDLLHDVQRCRNRVRRSREDSHHRVADRLHDSAGIFLCSHIE
jgi:hypothetical protein